MFIQLALASVMVLATVMIHLIGLAVLLRVMKFHRRMMRSRFTPLTLLLTATIGLFAIHTIEIWLYAALYLGLGAAAMFEEALYYSTVTYASIGYGDVLLAKEWRILGAIEGATGVIMLGWSTAFLVSLLAQMRLLGHDWLHPSRDGDNPNADLMAAGRRTPDEGPRIGSGRPASSSGARDGFPRSEG